MNVRVAHAVDHAQLAQTQELLRRSRAAVDGGGVADLAHYRQDISSEAGQVDPRDARTRDHEESAAVRAHRTVRDSGHPNAARRNNPVSRSARPRCSNPTNAAAERFATMR